MISDYGIRKHFSDYGIRKHFSEYVTRCLTEMEIRPWYAAYYCEICDDAFRKYMKGIRLPAPITLIMLAELFECSVNELLGYGYFPTEPREGYFDSGLDEPYVGKYFIEQLERLCGEKDISLADMATNVGISESTLLRYMQYRELPDTPIILNICDALNCTPSDLLGY